MDRSRTIPELSQALGEQIRALRLRQNRQQEDLAKDAGVALTALKNLESGKGATVRTLLKVLRALNRLDWLDSLSPPVSISPLQMIRQKAPRQRASRRRSPSPDR